MDYDLKRCTRQCAATERELAPGETFYSELVAEGAELVRYDYCEASWHGPHEKAIGWWKSQMPGSEKRPKRWAPNEVMLQFFDELAAEPSRQEMLYVLGLLLVRRRVMRLEESELDEEGRETMVLFCPRRDETYRVPVAPPNEQRTDEIQQELARLLE
jgi:hypothetical protein